MVYDKLSLLGFSSRFIFNLQLKRMIKWIVRVLESSFHSIVDFRSVSESQLARAYLRRDRGSVTYSRNLSASSIWILINVLEDLISNFSRFLMNNKPSPPNSDAKLRKTSNKSETVVSRLEISLLTACALVRSGILMTVPSSWRSKCFITIPNAAIWFWIAASPESSTKSK